MHPRHPSAPIQASNDVYLRQMPAEASLRTTLNLNATLLEEARKLTGMQERTALIHEGLRALISRESARRLALLGGSDSRVKKIRRRHTSIE